MDCSLPGFFVHGILQARVLGSVVISFSRGSSWPRDQTRVLCIAADSTIWVTRESLSQRLLHVFCCWASKEVFVFQDVLQFNNGSWEDILITLWFTPHVLQIQLKWLLPSHLGDLKQSQWQPWAYLLPSWWWILRCLAQKPPEKGVGGGGGTGVGWEPVSDSG